MLIGRDDLSAPLGPRAIRVSGAEQDSASGDRGLDFGASRAGLAARTAGAGAGQDGEGTGGEAAANVDGTRMDAEFDRLRFGRDRCGSVYPRICVLVPLSKELCLECGSMHET